MGTVNINLAEAQNLNLPLGLQLENEVTEVVFDFSAWQTAYGSGDLGLSIQRPGDSQPYAGELTIDGTDATWTVSSLDIAYKGVGEIQLTYTVGTVVKKSVIYKFTVYKSLGANGEYPSPGQTWQEEIEADIADVKADLNDLEDRVEVLEQGGGGSGLTADLKAALDQLAQKVAYIDEDGQDYYDALHNALYPPADLVSISAVYTQSGTVYDTDTLDSLKSDLVVTAHMSDSTTQTVTTYTLSGTLTEGTSTITVSYGGKTTSFTVVVSDSGSLPSEYESVEYIYNPLSAITTPTPVLDTGITLQGIGETVINISFMPTEEDNERYVIGCFNALTGQTMGMGISARDSLSSIDTFSGTIVKISPASVSNVKHNITATFSSTGASITDGTLSADGEFTSRAYNVAPVYLFGIKRAESNEVFAPFYGRIYKVIISENDETLFNAVPCVRLSDGSAGLYDYISRSFITANGIMPSPTESDTTAEIERTGKTQAWFNGVSIIAAQNAGITKKYSIPATTILRPAGIIPYGTGSPSAIDGNNGIIITYDENDTVLSHVSEYSSSETPTRWGQLASGTLVEYEKTYSSVPEYTKISFCVDLRYLDDAYMYDKTTGLIFFAGKNTPYYGMSNISEAQ